MADMKLDEAINDIEKIVEKYETQAQLWNKQTKDRIIDFCDKAVQAENNCMKCAKDYRQLAEWLRELKQLREQNR